ncbi:MAG: Ig-like domain-containing protein, partial [bacterium]
MRKKRIFWTQGMVILPFLAVVSCLGGDTKVAPLEGGLAHNPGKPPVQEEISITVDPPSASVLAGDSLQFTASISGTTDQRVTWSVVEGPSCGTISSTGLYTAPSTAPEGGKCHIRVTSVADPSKFATAEISITTSVVGCVAPAIPGFSGYVDIYSNPNNGQVDGPIGPGGTAEIDIDHATGIVDDGQNHFFIPDGNGGVRKIDLNVTPGQMTTVIDANAWSAGGGSGSLSGIALLANGDILVADRGVNVIWRVTQSGQMSLFAGVPGTSGYQDGPATSALFDLDEAGLTVDSTGNVYVADNDNCAVRKISPDGVVSTVAGGPNLCGYEDGPVATAKFEGPAGVAVDCNGNILVADYDGNRIRRIILTGPNAGTVVTVAGNGNGYDSVDNPDPLQADFAGP